MLAEFNSSKKDQNLEEQRAAEYFLFDNENEVLTDANFIAR